MNRLSLRIFLILFFTLVPTVIGIKSYFHVQMVNTLRDSVINRLDHIIEMKIKLIELKLEQLDEDLPEVLKADEVESLVQTLNSDIGFIMVVGKPSDILVLSSKYELNVFDELFIYDGVSNLEHGSLSVSIDDQDYFARFRSFNNNKWILITGDTVAEIYQEEADNQQQYVIELALTMLVLVFLSMVLSRMFLKFIEPVIRISNESVRSDGSLNLTLLPKNSSKEIGGLVRAYNRLILSVKEAAHAQAEKEKAIQANNSKSRFLANMSHEIRTPLNGVLGMVQLMRQTALTEEQVDMLNTVAACGDDLLLILNDILDLTKIESGKLELERVNFNINQAIEEIVFLTSGNASKKSLNVSYQKQPEDQSWYLGDVTRMRQIIGNLVDNAIKFTDEGEITIEVERKMDTAEQVNLVLKITDSGIGISQESQKKLFNDFVQADSSTTRRFGGTGLGLSICIKLARLMGGDIKLDSKVGRGSSFSVELPLSLGCEEKLLLDDPDDSTLLAERYPHHMLVVEDNAVNQKIARAMLSKLGYAVDVAANGIEAVQAVNRMHDQKSPYSVVFMDLQMPEMDGISATRLIRNKYSPSCLAVVALTANAFQDDIDKCTKIGMNGFLSKPLKTIELSALVKRLSIPEDNLVDADVGSLELKNHVPALCVEVDEAEFLYGAQMYMNALEVAKRCHDKTLLSDTVRVLKMQAEALNISAIVNEAVSIEALIEREMSPFGDELVALVSEVGACRAQQRHDVA